MSGVEFNQVDAYGVVSEAERLLSKAREALDAERYVEANAWVERVVEALKEQDVLGSLASGEIIAVEDARR